MRTLAIFLLCFSAIVAVAQEADPHAEQEIFRLLNLARAREGLSSLKFDPNLRQAALRHSQLMASAHQLSHQLRGEPVFSQRLSAAGARFSSSGENVAFDQTAQGAHEDLMHSPPHRANILSPNFNAVGVGVVRDGDNIWVTEDFAREFARLSNQDVRDQVFAAFQQVRRKAGAAPVKLAAGEQLQAVACRMARDGRLEVKNALALPGVHTAVAYTGSDLSHLPADAAKLAANSTIAKIAIGACFATSSTYPAGMYWVAIAGY